MCVYKPRNTRHRQRTPFFASVPLNNLSGWLINICHGQHDFFSHGRLDASAQGCGYHGMHPVGAGVWMRLLSFLSALQCPLMDRPPPLVLVF